MQKRDQPGNPNATQRIFSPHSRTRNHPTFLPSERENRCKISCKKSTKKKTLKENTEASFKTAMEAAFVARGGHGIFQCRACSLLQKVEKQLLVCGDTKVPNVHLERATVSATIAMEINLATFGRIPPLAPPSGTTCFNHFSQKLQTRVWSFCSKNTKQSKNKAAESPAHVLFFSRGRRTHP